MAENVQHQVRIAINGDKGTMHAGAGRAINVLATAEDQTRDMISTLESELTDEIKEVAARTDKRLKAITTLLTTIATLVAGGLVTLVTTLLVS